MLLRSSLLALLVIGLVGCQSDPNIKTPESLGFEPIKNEGEYEDKRQELLSLTAEPIIKLVSNTPLEELDLINLEKAEPIAKSLIHFHPTELYSRFTLGEVQRGLGKRLEAIQTFKEALNEATTDQSPDAQATRAQIHSSLGQIHFGAAEYEKSIEEYEKAIEMRPNDPFHRTNCAAAMIQLEKYDEAKLMLTSALQIDPNHKIAQDLLKLIEMGEEDHS